MTRSQWTPPSSAPIHLNTISKLDALHKQIAECGVGVWEVDYSPDWYKRRAPMLGESNVRRCARALAKELGRPFVWVTVGNRQLMTVGTRAWYTGWCAQVTVRRNKRLEPIVSALIMGAERAPKYYRHAVGGAVGIHQDGSNWHFTFTGDDGLWLFNHWLKQCRENEGFIKALAPRKPRVPQKVTP